MRMNCATKDRRIPLVLALDPHSNGLVGKKFARISNTNIQTKPQIPPNK